MKKIIFLFSISLFFSGLAKAQHTVIHYKNGEKANLGTLYSENKHFYISNIGGSPHAMYEGKDIGSSLEIDSITLTPWWKEKTIYRTLQESGKYNYTIRLIRETRDFYFDIFHLIRENFPNFTLFAASDEAWEQYFASPNTSHVNGYEALTQFQKQQILYNSLIKGPYWVCKASSYTDTYTLPHIHDSIPLKSEEFPSNSAWDRLRKKEKIYLEYEHLPHSLFNLTQKTDPQDLNFLLKEKLDPARSFYIFGIPSTGETICSNGSIYEMQEPIIPFLNTVEKLKEIPECSLFSSFIERLSYPLAVYHPIPTGANTSLTSEEYEDYTNIYEIVYPLIPTLNSRRDSTYLQTLFAPNNLALTNWLHTEEAEIFMGKKYASWEEVPLQWIALLVNNQVKRNAILPSSFSEIKEFADYASQGIRKEDIQESHLVNNGILYVTDKIYAPTIKPAKINFEGENGETFYLQKEVLKLETDTLPMILMDLPNGTSQDTEEKWSVSEGKYCRVKNTRWERSHIRAYIPDICIGKYDLYINFIPTTFAIGTELPSVIKASIRYASEIKDSKVIPAKIDLPTFTVNGGKVTRAKLAEIDIKASYYGVSKEDIERCISLDGYGGYEQTLRSGVEVYLENTGEENTNPNLYIDTIELIPHQELPAE